MKNVILKRGLPLLLALILLCAGLVSCGEEDVEEPEESSSATETEPAPPLAVTLSQYKIIRPMLEDDNISAASALLYEKMTERGFTPNIGDDFVANGASPDPDAYEILVGATNRPESAEALTQITEEYDFIIKFYEKKIVINATENASLSSAVGYFVENYLPMATDEGVLNVALGELYLGVGSTVLELVKDGASAYKIAYGFNASDLERELALRISNQIRTATGVNIRVYDDKSYDASAYEIVVGNTEYPETVELLSKLSYDEYGIFVVGKKILLVGHCATTTEMAVSDFLRQIKNQVTVDADRNYVLTPTVPKYAIDTLDTWLVDIPEFTGGKYEACFDVETDNIRLYYTDVQRSAVDPYVELLKADGYSVWQDNTLGENRFVTCLSGKGMVHLSYRKDTSSLSITTDPMTRTSLPEDDKNYTKVTDNALTVFALDYSHREVLDGNGMCYVITLEDGRYVIMDGGYNQDANRLYNYLYDNNKRADGKIVIAAWFMSHSHGDHTGAFEIFSARYGSKVTLEYFIASAYSESMMQEGKTYGGTFLSTSIYAYLKVFDGCKLVKPHAGQILRFCNVDFQIVYTHEELYPKPIDLENNTSTVIRMTMDGSTVLFAADAEATVSSLLVKMYGSALKSDVLQVNHHGYSGGTIPFYNSVAPSYLLWTTSNEAFAKRVSGVKYQWISAAAVSSNKHVYDMVGGAEKCFVAGGDCKIIRFMEDKSLSVTYYTPDDTYRAASSQGE